ncbi:MAG TPA: MarR family transcriptional regulator [Balneolaceae bacterium]|nr:MarR family transcriptional regulator [Balneolaceae bacterium]
MGEILKKRLKQDSFASVESEMVLNLMVTSYFLQNNLNEVLKKFDVTRGQFNVLRILKGVYPEGHARCDIIDRMIEPSPDVTRLVDRLEKAGYIERSRSQEDARRSITTITEQGLQKVEEINPEIEAFSKYIGNRLTEEECHKLSALCEKLYAERIE